MSIDALQSKIRKMKNPTMVCICPYYDQIPAYLRENARAEFGDTLRAAAEACRAFSCGILDALADIVPAVSVETACFTALGADGTTAMQQVLNYATQKGYSVLLDAMRCDIAPNAELLAQSCFGLIQVGDYGYRPYVCDGVLLSSYLGSDAVKPFTRFCAEGRNVFLLAHSSNKSAREVQDLLSGDRVVYQVMADLAMRWSTDLFGTNGYSEIGLVVGANNVPVLQSIRSHFAAPVVIHSAYRTPQYNAKVGGAAHSQHCYGTAADISVKGQTPAAVAAFARELMPDWGGVGVYAGQGFTHVDVREIRADWTG